jgi:hypothetical protein
MTRQQITRASMDALYDRLEVLDCLSEWDAQQQAEYDAIEDEMHERLMDDDCLGSIA